MTGRPKQAGASSDTAENLCPASSVTAGSRTVRCDPRWPYIAMAFAELRARHRHALRIVDANCACGTLLNGATRYARIFGCTAIEGLGICGMPTMVGRARAAAARLHDPAIGLVFAFADMTQALAQDAGSPAGILLCHDRHGQGDLPGIARLPAAAGDLVIGDLAPVIACRRAA